MNTGKRIKFTVQPYGGGASKESLCGNGRAIIDDCLKGEAGELARIYNAAPEMFEMLVAWARQAEFGEPKGSDIYALTMKFIERVTA